MLKEEYSIHVTGQPVSIHVTGQPVFLPAVLHVLSVCSSFCCFVYCFFVLIFLLLFCFSSTAVQVVCVSCIAFM